MRGTRLLRRHSCWVLLHALMLLTVAACDRSVLLDSVTPESSGRIQMPPIAMLSESVVDAPIQIALGETLAALESAVPRNFGDLEKRMTNPNNRRQQFAYAATRSPFTVSIEDGQLSLSTVISYQGRGWYNASLLPDVSASCGTDGLKPRLRLSLASPIGVSPSWKVTTRMRVATLRPYSSAERDACKVSIFDVDVTDRVVSALRGALGRELPRIDRRLARWDLKSRVHGWYNQMHRPIRVTDSVWLQLNPGDVRVGAISTTDSALVIQVRLFASPQLVTGTEPARIETALPTLSPPQTNVGDSAHLLLEARVEYAIATTLLNERLVGKTFSRWSRRVRVTGARLIPLGDGRLALGLRFEGALKGEGWLVGTPVLDVAMEQLTVPDLDFDVATGDMLTQGLAFLRTPAVLAQLREAAVLPLRDPLESLRESVERAINRELTDGVHLTGSLQRGAVIDVVPLADALMVRAEAVGKLGLRVDRELKVK